MSPRDRSARALFYMGAPLSPRNEERLIVWAQRWRAATGRQPDTLAYVAQRTRGLTFPVRTQPGCRIPLELRGIGEPRK